MVNDIQYAILDQVRAAGQDLDKVGKITSAENVDKVIEAKYPWYERHLDRVSFGVPVNVGGIVVPPFVDQNPQTVTAYRDITAAPPFAVGKDGKQKAVEQPDWQQAVNMSAAQPISPENKAGFARMFPGQDPDGSLRPSRPSRQCQGRAGADHPAAERGTGRISFPPVDNPQESVSSSERGHSRPDVSANLTRNCQHITQKCRPTDQATVDLARIAYHSAAPQEANK